MYVKVPDKTPAVLKRGKGKRNSIFSAIRQDVPFNLSEIVVTYLDLTFMIGSINRLYTKLYDKRDSFDFHIFNFPFLSSNIASSPSCDVYILQLIKYERRCSYYDDFGYRHKLLADRLLSQGYEVKRLRNSFKKFYGRYPDPIRKYQRSVKDMMADSFSD